MESVLDEVCKGRPRELDVILALAAAHRLTKRPDRSDGITATGSPWLAGRRVAALLDASLAVEASGGRAYFNRREQVGAKLLSEIGR